MSTRMEGIEQQSLFSGTSLKMDVIVPHGNRYRILAETLPWRELGEVANRYRAKNVDIDNGRPLNLRLHLGALIAQSMNRWTDRETEDMVAHHAGVRLLCALEFSLETIDHTSIETFRNQMTAGGVEAINQIVVKTAVKAGFTGSALCSSDTTVQESPIAYPTEVGKVSGLKGKSRDRYQEALDLYGLMLSQIRHWMKTGFHRPGKIVSLWEQQARAIVRNKAARAVEFGRRWIITRLQKGYIIGTACKKLGSDADTGILPEVLEHFERVMGEDPDMVVYDRGGDGPKNHRTLERKKIRHRAIFRKGKESLVGLGRNTVLKARRERALSEAAIATMAG